MCCLGGCVDILVFAEGFIVPHAGVTGFMSVHLLLDKVIIIYIYIYQLVGLSQLTIMFK